MASSMPMRLLTANSSLMTITSLPFDLPSYADVVEPIFVPKRTEAHKAKSLVDLDRGHRRNISRNSSFPHQSRNYLMRLKSVLQKT